MKINMGYPEKDDEVLILNRFLKEDPSKELSTVATCEDIVAMKEDAKNVYVHPVLIDYIVELARMTRQQDNVSIGVSPRGTLGMLNAARAYAYVAGRDYVVPEDIKILAPVVWAHRIVLQTGYMNMDNKEQIVEHVVNNTAVPTEDWKR
jgi:MoxR-like ATPase